MTAKDQWIERTMESLDNLPQAEANPYLFEKVMNRMQRSEKESLLSKKLLLRLSFVLALLVLLNIISVKKYHSGRSENDRSSADNEYMLNFTYNY
jgi:hypothetical protein